jgi:hypothetical protein
VGDAIGAADSDEALVIKGEAVGKVRATPGASVSNRGSVRLRSWLLCEGIWRGRHRWGLTPIQRCPSQTAEIRIALNTGGVG